MNLKKLLKETKNIAIVGASSNPERDSYKVMKFLIDYGFDVYPVNPNEAMILGRESFSDLTKIRQKIDMVDVFRAREFVLDITKQAIKVNADIFGLKKELLIKNQPY